MPKVIVSAATHNLIRSLAQGQFDDSRSRRLADGRVEIPLSEDVISRIKELSLEGETMDDTIVRVASTAGRNLN